MNDAERPIDLMREARRVRFTDAARAYELSTQAVQVCRQQNARRDLIRALKLLGQLERDSGNLEDALVRYEEAVALCRLEDDSLLLAHTVRHLGDIHQDAHRLDLAEPCYDEALKIYRSQPDTDSLDLANAVRPFAILKEAQGHTAEAKQLFSEARDLYDGCNIPQGVAEMTRRLELL